MDVTETMLPGVGMRYEFLTKEGDRVGVISYRDGRNELVTYSADDPDVCQAMLKLTKDEAETIAEILGAPRIAERFADLTREIPGLVAKQVPVPAGSRYLDQTLGSTRARTRTGASIVAVVRSDGVIASPGPDEILREDDVLVVVGTEDGTMEVNRIVSAPA